MTIPMHKSNTMERAEFLARSFVQGVARNERSERLEPISANWSSHFIEHPWVRDSVHRGWARALRAHVVAAVKSRVINAMLANPAVECSMSDVRRACSDINELMPPKEWADTEIDLANRSQAAAAWRGDNPHHHARPDKPPRLAPGDRHAFRAMQEASKNKVHRKPWGLTERTRNITGERE